MQIIEKNKYDAGANLIPSGAIATSLSIIAPEGFGFKINGEDIVIDRHGCIEYTAVEINSCIPFQSFPIETKLKRGFNGREDSQIEINEQLHVPDVEKETNIWGKKYHTVNNNYSSIIMVMK